MCINTVKYLDRQVIAIDRNNVSDNEQLGIEVGDTISLDGYGKCVLSLLK